MLNTITGIFAVLLSGILSIILMFIIYKADLIITRKIDEEKYLLEGKISVSIMLGSVLMSQAILVRHAIHPVMTVIRTAIINRLSGITILSTIVHSVLFVVIMSVLSILLVGIIMWLFSRMNKRINEQEEILKDNIAVAIFLAFVVISVTIIIDQGMADLAQSMIPVVQRGVIRIG